MYRTIVEKGPLTDNLFDVITKAMFEVQDMLIASWMEYLDKYKEIMTLHVQRYISHVIFICCTQKSVINDIYERFIIVCALVTVIGVHAYNTTGKKFYKLTPPILTVLFEKDLKKDFKKRGGWKSFEKYLMGQDYVEYYKTYSVFLVYKDESKDIPIDIKEKMRAFVTRRKYFNIHFSDEEIWQNDSKIPSLISEVVNSIDASLLTTLNAMPPTSSVDEKSVSKSLSEVSTKEEPTHELGEKSKASGSVDIDKKNLS